jgi:hypothetical protein
MSQKLASSRSADSPSKKESTKESAKESTYGTLHGGSLSPLREGLRDDIEEDTEVGWKACPHGFGMSPKGILIRVFVSGVGFQHQDASHISAFPCKCVIYQSQSSHHADIQTLQTLNA